MFHNLSLTNSLESYKLTEMPHISLCVESCQVRKRIKRLFKTQDIASTNPAHTTACWPLRHSCLDGTSGRRSCQEKIVCEVSVIRLVVGLGVEKATENTDVCSEITCLVVRKGF